MGQSASSDSNTPDTVGYLQEVARQTRFITELAGLSYEEFQQSLSEINKLTRQCVSSDGKQLVFAVKKGTDSSVLWKGTVKVACVKVDPDTRAVESFRLLNLAEFFRVSKTIHSQLIAARQSGGPSGGPEQEEGIDVPAGATGNRPVVFSAATLLHEMAAAEGDKLTECCICLERKPDVMLPCAHSYCLPCIQQWNVNNNTCPLCREFLDSDEAWVISEAPGAHEISNDLCNSLMALASGPRPTS